MPKIQASWLLFVCPGLLSLSACTADVAAGPAAGTLVVDWTVSGTKDPAQCDASSSASLSLAVRQGGASVGEFVADCRDFSESVVLGPGGYDGDAVLLDGAGNQRTTAVPIGPFNIYGGDQVIVPINFPASSFF